MSWQDNLVESEQAILEIARNAKRVAVLGIKPESRAGQPAHYVAKYLADQGVEIVPVPTYYPDVETILGRQVVRQLEHVGAVDIVDVFRRSEDVPAHLDALLELAPPVVWMQLGIRHDETAEKLAKAGIRVVQDRCLLVDHRRAMKQTTPPRIPWLTTEQMIEVDRAMMEDARILLIQMMENAGRNLATLARDRFLDGDPRSRTVVVLAGTGGNGGGGMVAARRLHSWGAQVVVYITHPERELPEVPAHQLDVLRRIGIDVKSADELPSARPDLVIDALIGYSLRGAPRGPAATMMEWANASGSPILSLDVPSGLDASTGSVAPDAVRATATMTLALPKEGLRAPGVVSHVGELYLADIGVPPSLYAGPGLKLDVGPLFAEREIIRI